MRIVFNEKKLICFNYTYVIFGKKDVYKDKFEWIFDEVNRTFKKIKKMAN